MKRSVCLLGVLLALGVPGGLRAQVDTATLVGTVRDSTGAVIPGATLTATAVETNISATTKTDTEGNYVVTPLKIGRYAVTAEAGGFKKQTRENITLNVQDRLRVDFDLQVGAVTETVNVKEAVPLIQSETSALGDVIGSDQVTSLPLNGRDYTVLATLTTGVAKIVEGPVNGGSSPTNGNAGGNFVANGTRGNLNNFMLDGIDNNSNDNASYILYTSVDAIQEFKVQTSTYSAEFGRAGGAVINASIKSGTNQFHGSGFEFLRNEAVDARGFFEPPGPKAPYKENHVGGTLGGPIQKDKTFFFGDYEATRIRKAVTDISTVPTLAERGGDFSVLLGGQLMTCGTGGTQPCFDALGRPVYDGELYDPSTTRTVSGTTVRDGFGFNAVTGLPTATANIIPTSAVNSISQAYANLYPDPTVAGALSSNYIVNDPGSDRIDQFDTRIDHNLSSTNQIFGRFSLSQRTRFQHPPLPGLADGGNYGTGFYYEATRGAALAYTHTFSPTVVNELRLGFNRKHYRDNVPAYGQNFPSTALQVPGVPNNSTINGLTLFQLSPYRRLGEPGYTPTFSTSQEFQLGDTLNIVRGRHTIKTGAQFRRSQFNLFQVGQPRGRMNFSGQFTQDNPASSLVSGNGLADMLLGLPNFSVISTLTYMGNRQHVYGGFIQDDFKVSSALTLNLGLRYDYTGPAFESHDRQSNFDYSTGQIVVANRNGQSRGLVNADKLDFAPRLGFAYSPFADHKTVLRGGFYRAYNYQEIRTGDPLQLGYNLPFFFEPSFVSDGITPVLTLNGPNAGFPSLDISQAKLAGVTSNDARLHAPVFDGWNFNLERELPGQAAVEIAYVGSKGTHLQVLVDHNQDPTPGPGDVQSRRPYPQYGVFTAIENHGNSTFHSFQVKVTKRTSHGLSLLSAFTYGKSINDQPEICCSSPWPQNSYNLAAEKGLSDFDERRRWVTSFLYELPVGHGKRYLSNSRYLDLALGGWNVNGILTFRSGFPFSPLMGYDPSNTGSVGMVRTNVIGSGNLPPSKRTPDLWFDITQFPVPSCLCFGNAGKNILDGPGERTADLSLQKTFSLTERYRLDFYAQFFSAFNHVVLAQPDNFITDGLGSAGVITSTVLPQRQVQFGLKLSF